VSLNVKLTTLGSDPLAKFLRWSKNLRGGLTPPPLARLLYEVVEKFTRESDPSEAVSAGPLGGRFFIDMQRRRDYTFYVNF